VIRVRLVPSFLSKPLATLGAAAKNAVEVARLGGLDTGEQASPYRVVARDPMYRLRHYESTGVADGSDAPPILLVPPLMLTAEVYDVSPQSSAVQVLLAAGVDPWVIDFGSPEREVGGTERTLADHVLAVSAAVDRIRSVTGRDVTLAGYSQGGMFCYQAAAYRRSEGIASLVTFGSPVDLRGALPLGLPESIAIPTAAFTVDVLGGRAVPAWVTRNAFSLLDPVHVLRQRLDFVRQLHDREALLPREGQRRFLMGQGWVAWPGPAVAEFVRQFLVHNRMLAGGFTIGDHTVTLADIDVPILYFVGDEDDIAPAPAVRAIRQAAPRARLYEVSLPAGHFGLVVGRTAGVRTWPVVSVWTHWVSGDIDELPDVAHYIDPAGALVPVRPAEARSPLEALQTGVGYALGSAVDTARSLADSTRRSLAGARQIGEEALVQLPRLARLGRTRLDTKLSLALLLDERARQAPQDVLFLFGDRAYTNAAVKGRIDSIVRGLISIGVHQGEHVAVLMGTRPSALALVAALNRLGAVVVLLRPGGDVGRQLVLGQATRIICDAEEAAGVRRVSSLPTYLFGGGGRPRDTGGLIDLEQVDISKVRLPRWYEPNMGRGGDLAFVLFTGDADNPRPNRITNSRWALSAFGTASGGALTRDDTVYSINPLSHPSGLLTSVGGAVAGGARLALATSLDVDTFWAEARRYGVTVVSYVWAQLRDIVDAPPNAFERHHSIRLLVGSGMPPGLWRRAEERFATARVLEFWAATEGQAVLANVRDVKPGCQGRPLPDSAELRVARYDTGTGQLVLASNGLALPARPGQPGLLLAKAEQAQQTIAPPLRSVFSRGDAWLSTEALFVRDADGDHWLVDALGTLLRRRGVAVPALPIVRALSEIDAVDLAVTYGVEAAEDRLVVVAFSVRSGFTVSVEEVGRALAALPTEQQPDVVRVVGQVPLSDWHRPVAGHLPADGLGRATKACPLWYREAGTGRYRTLTPAARNRLLGAERNGSTLRP
jgi:putative long chain acyl-CoA synthase